MSRVATATTPSTTSSTTPMNRVPHERIAARAFEMWVKRGRPQGTELQDWLEAEKELCSDMSRTAGATPQRR